MRLELSRFVEGDLEDIASHIARSNPRRALTFIQEIRTKFRAIKRDPLLCRLRPEVGDEARLASVGNHVILFRVVAKVVRIERVTHGARDLPALLDPP